MSADYKGLENMLRAAVEQKNKKQLDAERAAMMQTIGGDIVRALTPVLSEIAQRSAVPVEGIQEAISRGVSEGFARLKIPAPQVNVSTPDVIVPAFKFPEIPAPRVNVNVPNIKIPDIIMPDEMNTRGWLSIVGWDHGLLNNPLPVQLRDAKGNPLNLFENLTTLIGGSGGGGGFRHVIIDDIKNISASLSVSSTPYGTYFASDAIGSVNVAQVGGSAVVVGSGYQDNALRVVHATDSIVSVNIVSGSSSGATGQGDAASALRVVVAGNSDASVSVNAWNGNAVTVGTGYQDNALRVVHATDAIASVNNTQWNGNTIPVGTGYQDNALRVAVATDSVASVVVNSGTITTVTTVTSVTNSLAAYIVDSGGVGYNGSNPVPTTLVSGGITSTLSVGDSAARSADNGGNPVKVGGIARTTNPTAYADGDRANFGSDKLGRQLIRNVQVRELLLTAYTTVSTGTEATILTAAAGTYADCIWMAFSNTSSAAQQIDVRAVSGGNIVHTAYIPANSTIGWVPAVPWPQDATGNAWTVDGADVTNSTVYVTALFSKEI